MTEQRLTISEDRIRQLFADFKLELFELFAKKADAALVEVLASRVTHLELWQAAMVATEGTKERLSARQLAIWAIAATLVAAVVAATASLVYSVLSH